MKLRIVLFFAFVMLLSSQGFMAAQTCTPNGNRFNLEPLKNAVSQLNPNVAVLPNRGGGGADLVFGVAQDERNFLPPGIDAGLTLDAFYVQRDNSNCAADLEGGFPIITNPFGDQALEFGFPTVAADPAHDAFFVSDMRFEDCCVILEGIIKTTAATLLNPQACTNGTQANPVTCFEPVGQLVVPGPTESVSGNPSIAVDQRTTGTGAGDVYVVNQQTDGSENRTITVWACTNSLSACSQPTLLSGLDNSAFSPWVQVRTDGGITVSYIEVLPGSTSTSDAIRFVNCTPAGAPNSPTCSAPLTVITDDNVMSGTYPGDVQVIESTYPRHVDRLDSNGTSVTTFVVYDRCQVPLTGPPGALTNMCSKSDVAVTSSADGGKTWSAIQAVPNGGGQQFFSNLALDSSTGTVNLAYYSTEKDSLKTRTQVFLAQILPGQTTVSAPHQITTAFYDAPIPDLVTFATASSLNGLGLAVGGTGTAGQSHVYIHFQGNTVQGTYDGVPFPVANNILTRFEY